MQNNGRPCWESGQVTLVCFPWQNLVFSDSERLTREPLFQGLHVHVGFDPFYQEVWSWQRDKRWLLSREVRFGHLRRRRPRR